MRAFLHFTFFVGCFGSSVSSSFLCFMQFGFQDHFEFIEVYSCSFCFFHKHSPFFICQYTICEGILNQLF